MATKLNHDGKVVREANKACVHVNDKEYPLVVTLEGHMLHLRPKGLRAQSHCVSVCLTDLYKMLMSAGTNHSESEEECKEHTEENGCDSHCKEEFLEDGES